MKWRGSLFRSMLLEWLWLLGPWLLGVLAVIVPSSETERIRLIGVTEHLRGIVQSIDLSAGQMRDSIAAAGLLASKSWLDKELSESGTVKFCRAHGLPLGKLRPAIAANAD